MLNRLLNYVEIKTKITSLFAFLMSLAFLFYKESLINWPLTLLFFVSMFLFDLTTTAINNYIDTKTNGLNLPFERKRAKWIIYLQLGASIGSGLALVAMTDVVVLMIGGLCFLTGVFYTYGPIPISRQPWGELLSGVFYGLWIPFLILYINLPEGSLLILHFDKTAIELSLPILPLVSLGLLAVVPTCTTANIMLANNICDVEKDIRVKRYTLPYYIGDKALTLFAALYYLAYGAILLQVLTGMLSWVCLLTLLTLPTVHKKIRMFMQHQEKATTFMVSIVNYVLLMGSFTATLLLSGLVS